MVDERGAVIEKWLRGRNWNDLPGKSINEDPVLRETILHLTPKAFAYYLPGFLLAALYEDEMDVAEIADETFLILLRMTLARPDYDAVYKSEYEERMRELKRTQLGAVVDFIRFFDSRPWRMGSNRWVPSTIEYLTALQDDKDSN